MIRRSILGAGLMAALVSRSKAAVQQVGATPQGVPIMRASVQHPSIAKQQCPLWCWAASAEMIFASHGRRVPQMAIVQRAMGVPACVASGPTRTISAVLSVPWQDAQGTFQPRITAGYDAFEGVNQINNNFIVNELSNNRPLLYCNQSHAMVVVAMDFLVTPIGPNPVAVGVLDPWPGSPDFHVLSAAEATPVTLGGQMTYLAAVHI